MGVLSDFMVERSLKVTNQQRDTFGRARAKGVRIALGTDARFATVRPSSGGIQGDAHDEPLRHVEGGSCYQCDSDCSRSAGMEHEIGSVEPGKLADLLVLETNPYEDLDAFTKHLVSVYKEGMLV